MHWKRLHIEYSTLKQIQVYKYLCMHIENKVWMRQELV